MLAEEDAKRRDEKFGRLSRGWVVGSPQFKDALKKEFAGEISKGKGKERFAVLGADTAAHREMRAELWEEKLQQAAKLLGESLDELPEALSAPPKVRLAALMKATTSVSNGWLAERLAMGQPASVSQYVRRFRLAGGCEEKSFKVVVAKLKR